LRYWIVRPIVGFGNATDQLQYTTVASYYSGPSSSYQVSSNSLYLSVGVGELVTFNTFLFGIDVQSYIYASPSDGPWIALCGQMGARF
jgi:hypothetical protein